MSETSDAPRILIVDDDEALRSLFRLSMEPQGFAVEEAADGIEGIKKAQASAPALIVLDLMMPRLSGVEVLHRLQDLGLDRIPVIIVTAYSREVSEEILRRESNVVEFIEKPIKYAELAAKVRRYVGLADGK